MSPGDTEVTRGDGGSVSPPAWCQRLGGLQKHLFPHPGIVGPPQGFWVPRTHPEAVPHYLLCRRGHRCHLRAPHGDTAMRVCPPRYFWVKLLGSVVLYFIFFPFLFFIFCKVVSLYLVMGTCSFGFSTVICDVSVFCQINYSSLLNSEKKKKKEKYIKQSPGAWTIIGFAGAKRGFLCHRWCLGGYGGL